MEAQARGAAFLTLVVGNLILALSDSVAVDGRLFAPRRRIFWAIATATITTTVLNIPAAEKIFRVATPEPVLLIGALLAATMGGGWFALVRRVQAWTRRRGLERRAAG